MTLGVYNVCMVVVPVSLHTFQRVALLLLFAISHSTALLPIWMWIRSVWGCECVCMIVWVRGRMGLVLLSICKRGVVAAHCTVANLLCMWMHSTPAHQHRPTHTLPCLSASLTLYLLALLWQSANPANCSKMTFGTRQQQKMGMRWCHDTQKLQL